MMAPAFCPRSWIDFSILSSPLRTWAWELVRACLSPLVSFKNMGGPIWAESDLGQGSTFIVELPVKQWIPEMIEAPAGKPQAPTRKRILVVDDEDTVAKLIVRGLTKQGHKVHAVLTAAAAFRKLADNDYDLIVSDIKMPGLSGEQLYEHIAESDPRLAKRIIFITGDAIAPSTQQLLQGMEISHIVKPLQLDRLQEPVGKALAAIDEVEGGPCAPSSGSKCEPDLLEGRSRT
jgi:CheY-like chemotaxis protein